MRFALVVFLLIVVGALAVAPARGQLRPVPVIASTRPDYVAAPNEVQAPSNEADKFYDPANPDSHKLQRSDDALATLPHDKRGMVDWMRALRDGSIAPRADVKGEAKMQAFELDIILKNTKDMPWVRFPHNSHAQWLACANCHDGIFIAKAGANPIDMTKIFRGEYCGTCHGRVAFVTALSCERCHSVPHGEVKAWW